MKQSKLLTEQLWRAMEKNTVFVQRVTRFDNVER